MTSMEPYCKWDFPFVRDVDWRRIAAKVLDPSIPKTLLWVDGDFNYDHNIRLQQEFVTAGVNIVKASSTAEGVLQYRKLKEAWVGRLPESKFRVITNKTRVEYGQYNYKAGVDFARALRVEGYTGPVLIFCSDLASARRDIEGQIYLLLSNNNLTAKQFGAFDLPFLYQQPALDDETASSFFSRLVSEGMERKEKDGFVKYYIPRGAIAPGESNLSTRVFSEIEAMLNRSVQLQDKLVILERVIVVENPGLRRRFVSAMKALDAQFGMEWPRNPADDPVLNVLRSFIPETRYRNARPLLLWHQTRDSTEGCVNKEGYKVKKVGSAIGNDGWYGKGMYFTNFPTYAYTYANPRTAAMKMGRICLQLSWVLVGRPYHQARIDVGRALEPGFTTHYSLVKRTRPIAEFPTGLPDGDEVVIFHDAHMLPMFIVELNTRPA